MTLFIFLYIPILAWVSGFPFVIGLAEKLYKILHALNVIKTTYFYFKTAVTLGVILHLF
ncbi:hypothetical protein EMIT079MI2_370007 [Bacillus sp. IT-79MI2]